MLDGIVINDNSLVIFIRLNSEESCIEIYRSKQS